jgi:tRNA1(Val) A37 N6-methylase TrmN6
VEERVLKEVKLPFDKVIYQHKNGQSITEDTALLVEIILSENTDSGKQVLDLGSGTGIISIMLSNYRPGWNVIGIEIQEQLVELAQNNNLSAGTDASFLCDDQRKPKPEWQNGFDLIVANPPYFVGDKGKVSGNMERAISRTELTCTMKDVFTAVTSYLNPEGSAYVIYPLERRAEVHMESANRRLVIISETELGEKNKKIVFRMKKEQ